MDRDGNLVDSMLSETRDMVAAKKFFQQAKEASGCSPQRVTTDGHDSYPRAIGQVLGRKVGHRTNRYLNNRLEQDHRGVKQRTYPMRGFGSFDGAARFAARTMNNATTFGRVPNRTKRCRSRSNASYSGSALQPCKTS